MGGLSDMSPRRHGTSRLRCVVLVHHAEAMDTLADLCLAMQDDPDFEPIVLSLPRHLPSQGRFGGEAAIHEELSRLGIPHHRFHLADDHAGAGVVRALAPDFVFRQTPWDNDIQPAFSTERLGFTRVCYAPYALPLIERYMVDAAREKAVLQSNSAFLQSCFRVYCETPDSRAQFVAAGAHPAAAVVLGSPKFDRLSRACRSRPAWPIAPRPGSRPTRILWAPHHSIGPDWLGFGVFVGIVGEMTAWAASDPGVEIALKPHPALFDQMRQFGVGEIADKFLEVWNALPNTAIVEGGDYGPLFAGSDMMVTDGLSFLFEYLFADKPLIFVDSGRHVPFNATGRRAVEGAYPVTTFASLRDTVDRLRSGTADHLGPARREIVDSYFRADGRSVARILDDLRQAAWGGAVLRPAAAAE